MKKLLPILGIIFALLLYVACDGTPTPPVLPTRTPTDTIWGNTPTYTTTDYPLCTNTWVPGTLTAAAPATNTPTPQSTADCPALSTRVAQLDAKLVEIETLIAEVMPTCGALWSACCVPATMTAEASTPGPSATPRPVASPTLQLTTTPVTEFIKLEFHGGIDTFIYRYAADADYSSDGILKLGYKDQNRIICAFDASLVPADASVVSATLKLWVFSWSAEHLVAVPYVLYTESDHPTWNKAAPGVPWSAAGAGGAGTDRDEEPTSTGTDIFTFHDWAKVDLTLAVRRWITSLPNYGVVLYSNVASSASYQFVATESADIDHRPILEIVLRNPDWR